MAKYRIRVESLDGELRLKEQFGEGIECVGFVILGERGNSGMAVIHDVTTMDIAQLIKGE